MFIERCFLRPAQTRRQHGAVLLEVVLALVLFVAAATIISAGLNASLDSVDRLRLNTHAANLAVSVLSELQMGIKTTAVTGPQQFKAPFEGWTWEIQTATADSEFSRSSSSQKIEIIIRHDDPAIVYRLSQILQIDGSKSIKDQTAALGGRSSSLP